MGHVGDKYFEEVDLRYVKIHGFISRRQFRKYFKKNGCNALSIRGYICTRNRNHPGRHMATIAQQLVDAWKKEV